jgi:tRNA nucleotidyltransferase/poly(A) polymerase
MCSDVAFEADPLRMLRAVRFARQLACKIEFRTRESMCCNSSLITRSARERIKRELFMILHGPDQEISLRELHDCGLLERLLPDMRLMDSEFQNVAQEHLLLENLLRSLGFLEEVSRITDARFEGVRQQLSDYLNREFEEGVSMMSLLTFAVLLFHIVQVGEVVAVKPGARVCLHGNDKSIIKIIQRIARGIGLGRKAQHVLACLVENNMRIQQMAQRESLGERAKVRFVLDCGDVAVGVCLLAIADSLATASQGSNQRVRDIAHDLCKFILVSQDLHEAVPLLTGDDIITSFGLKAGPHVGDVLRQAAQLERDGILQDRKAALIWLHSLSPNG